MSKARNRLSLFRIISQGWRAIVSQETLVRYGILPLKDLSKLESKVKKHIETLRTEKATEQAIDNEQIGKPRDLMRMFERANSKAYKESGLDSGNPSHRELLFGWMALALFGPKGPGRSKKWTRKRYRKLRADVSVYLGTHPNLSEERCCAALIKNHVDPFYEGKTAKNLRRALQNAKLIEKTSASQK